MPDCARRYNVGGDIEISVDNLFFKLRDANLCFAVVPFSRSPWYLVPEACETKSFVTVGLLARDETAYSSKE